MSKLKPSWPAGDFKGVPKGSRFTTKRSFKYYDKTFPSSSKVTFLGMRKMNSLGWIFPRFQFDSDSHTSRVLELKDLEPAEIVSTSS